MRILYRASIFALSIAALLAGACKKTPPDPNTVTIVNRISEDVVLDIYADMNGYATNSGTKVFSQTVGALSRVDIPPSVLQPGVTYYMDWHNANYSKNNWFNDAFKTTEPYFVAITPVKGDNAYDLAANLGGMARTTFLNDTGITTHWVAVGAYLFSNNTGYVSFWDSLSTDEQYHEVTVNKNFTAVLKYRDNTGGTITQTHAFNVLRSQEAYIELMHSDTTVATMLGGRLPGGQAPDYKSASTDTVMAVMPNSVYTFMMVKQ